MVLRRREFGPVVHFLGVVVVVPVLTRLEAADERMPGRGGVRGRVLHGRGVTAADVPALRAPAQVHPPAARGLALDAAFPARRHRRIDSGDLRHGQLPSESESCQVSGSRTRNRVSPGDDSSVRSPWCLFTTMRHEMSSPSPVPSPTGLVVKNGSNIRFLISAGTPGPVSPNSTNTCPRSIPVRTVRTPEPPMADTALSIRFVHTWFSSTAYAGTGGTDRSYSFTTEIPGGNFPDSISSVLSSSSCTSMTWYGARSSCEYCLAAPTRVEIRVVESSISFISSSVSTVQYSQRSAPASVAASTVAATWSSHEASSPAATKAGASCQPSSSPWESSQSATASSRSDASSGERACAFGT